MKPDFSVTLCVFCINIIKVVGLLSCYLILMYLNNKQMVHTSRLLLASGGGWDLIFLSRNCNIVLARNYTGKGSVVASGLSCDSKRIFSYNYKTSLYNYIMS